MKVYGRDNTSLRLTDKAYQAYANTDPLTITEYADGTYDIDPYGRQGLSAAEVNEWLETLAE